MPQPDKLNPIKLSKAQPPITFDGVLGWTRTLTKGVPKRDGPAVIGENYVLPGSWTGNVIIHPDRIAACPPDKLLTIDVWDQS